MDEKYTGPERRKLSEEDLDSIKEQLLESIYADIGKSIVKKAMWAFGAILLASFAWMKGSGHI